MSEYVCGCGETGNQGGKLGIRDGSCSHFFSEKVGKGTVPDSQFSPKISRLSVLLMILFLALTFLTQTVEAAELPDATVATTSPAPEITKTKVLNGGIRLTWGAVQGAERYRVYRKDGTLWKRLSDVTGVTYTDKNVISGESYTYTVRCYYPGGKSGYDKEGTTVQYFAAPQLASAVNKNDGILVRWKSVGGIHLYQIYRKTGSSGWSKVAKVSGTSWTDTNAAAGETYTYTVRCVSADGKRMVSSYESKGISAPRLTVPVLVSAQQAPDETVFKWKAVAGATGYVVYRRTAGSSGWTRLGKTSSLQYTDRTTSEQMDYYYTVRAYQGSAKGGYNTIGLKAVHYDPVQQLLSKTRTARKTNQIILVIDHNLTFWNKNSKGTWKKAMDVYCGYGLNGMRLASARREGDKTTPIGAFPMTLAFGLGENPGTKMEYRRITANSYWSGAKDSTYNTWVESPTRISGEHLIDYYQYKYAMAIGFNMNPVVLGRGSAIFLHCKSRDHWYTAGCVSVVEADMLYLMRNVDDGAYMIIVPNEQALADY